MEVLYIFMGLAGLASVLPVALPFQIHSMALGGVKHVGLLIAAFELVAQLTLACLDLETGAHSHTISLPPSLPLLIVAPSPNGV